MYEEAFLYSRNGGQRVQIKKQNKLFFLFTCKTDTFFQIFLLIYLYPLKKKCFIFVFKIRRNNLLDFIIGGKVLIPQLFFHFWEKIIITRGQGAYSRVQFRSVNIGILTFCLAAILESGYITAFNFVVQSKRTKRLVVLYNFISSGQFGSAY